jgi:hypothetical protein
VRSANLIVTAALSAAVIGEGAYIIKTQRKVETLSDQVQQLVAESLGQEGSTGSDERPARSFTAPASRAGQPAVPARLPPPKFANAPTPLPPPTGTTSQVPLPAGLDNPEAREQLRNFVASELQRERDEQRDRFRQQRDEMMQRRLDQTIKTLGLNADEGKRLTDVLAAQRTAREELRNKIQAGQIAGQDMGKQFTALREQTDQQLRQVLGDDRLKKFQELQRQNGGGRGGGGPEGGRFRGPGGGGDPGGAPPPTP